MNKVYLLLDLFYSADHLSNFLNYFQIEKTDKKLADGLSNFWASFLAISDKAKGYSVLGGTNLVKNFSLLLFELLKTHNEGIDGKRRKNLNEFVATLDNMKKHLEVGKLTNKMHRGF